MSRRFALIVAMSLPLAGLACSDKPHEYSRERPPVDQLDSRDKGLQSKDVVNASDKMAMDLLTLPEVNASPTQLTVVFTGMENQSSNPTVNYQIFLERVRVNVARQGRGRLAIIDNRDRVANIQSRELDSAPQQPNFGQGGVPQGATGPGGIQPEYALYGTVQDMPNRGTNYYLFTFNLSNMRTRQILWSNQYEVKVAR